MRYLVIGGASFMGSNFVRYLLKHYDDVQVGVPALCLSLMFYVT